MAPSRRPGPRSQPAAPRGGGPRSLRTPRRPPAGSDGLLAWLETLLTPKRSGPGRGPKAITPRPSPPGSGGSGPPIRTPTLTPKPSATHGISPWLWALPAAVVVVLIALAATWASLPDPNNLRDIRGNGAVVVRYDDHSQLDIRGKRPGPLLQVEDVSEYIRRGFVATEDRRFYEHNGIDWWGIGRAAVVDLTSQRHEGGSTITQQLVRNYPGLQKARGFESDDEGDGYKQPSRSIFAKVREALMAAKLELAFPDKRVILQSYMTVIPYGTNKFGVDDAAKYYFGKSASNVTLSEAAMIVGAANGPHLFDPHRDPNRSWQRALQVIQRMQDNGDITAAQADAARVSPPVIRPVTTPLSRFAVERIQASFKLKDAAAELNDELEVATTLNRQAQDAAEAAIQKYVPPGQPLQAVLVAVDGTGAIKAFVPATSFRGGSGYADDSSLQIGSVMKALIYSTAMEQGGSPQDLCDDLPIPPAGRDRWSPHNDDGKAAGTLSLHSAFGRSSNIVAVRLANEVGYPAVSEFAAKLRMPPLPPGAAPAWPLSVAASPLEVVRAFLPFSNGGYARQLRFVDNITNRKGELQYTAPAADQQPPVLSARSLSAMHDVMRGVITDPGSTGTGAAVQGLWVAGKTGTTSGFRQAWFVGYGDNFAVAVWVGRPQDNHGTKKMFGGTVPAAIFRQFMSDQQMGWGRQPPVGARPEDATDANVIAPVATGYFQGKSPTPPARGFGCQAR